MQSSSPGTKQAVLTYLKTTYHHSLGYCLAEGCSYSSTQCFKALHIWPHLLSLLWPCSEGVGSCSQAFINPDVSVLRAWPRKEPSSILQGGLLPCSWEKTVGTSFVAATFCTASDYLRQSKACPLLHQAKQDLLAVLHKSSRLHYSVSIPPQRHMAELGTQELSCPSEHPPAAGGSWASCRSPHLEVVLHVAVCVLWGVQEDEQVLAQVVGHCRQPRQS